MLYASKQAPSWYHVELWQAKVLTSGNIATAAKARPRCVLCTCLQVTRRAWWGRKPLGVRCSGPRSGCSYATTVCDHGTVAGGLTSATVSTGDEEVAIVHFPPSGGRPCWCGMVIVSGAGRAECAGGQQGAASPQPDWPDGGSHRGFPQQGSLNGHKPHHHRAASLMHPCSNSIPISLTTPVLLNL